MKNKTINIVQVTSYYPPHLGGMQNVVKEISEKLVSVGYKVEVYTSNGGNKREEIKSVGNPRVHYLWSFEFAHTPIIFLLFFRLLFISRDSIIHLHVAQAFTPEIVFLISKLRKIPYIAHIHLDVDESGVFGFLLKPYKKYILVHVLRNASKIICLSSDQKKLIVKKYNLQPIKVVIIPNGVGEEFFVGHRVRKNKVQHLLFVGRFSVQKNIPLLINAVALLKNNLILDIVGEGEKRGEIERLINEKKIKNVILHGQKNGKELINFYKNADIFVITSQKEGLSVSMLEAMAAGLPIVGTSVTGIKDLIKDVGILVSNDNPNKLAEILDNLISNKTLREKLSKKSVAKAKKFRWEKIVEMIEKVYRKI